MVALNSSTFYEKSHSRARSIASSRADSSRCKSLQRIEMRLSIYESRVGLDSFSRDPIGFGGSPHNLYEYVQSNPQNRLDPLGLCTVHCYRAVLGHITCWISSSQNPSLGGINLDGTADNGAEETGHRPAPDRMSIIGTFRNLPEESVVV